MPYGIVNPLANTSLVSTLPSLANPRICECGLGSLRYKKIPFGAVTIVRGVSSLWLLGDLESLSTCGKRLLGEVRPSIDWRRFRRVRLGQVRCFDQ